MITLDYTKSVNLKMSVIFMFALVGQGFSTKYCELHVFYIRFGKYFIQTNCWYSNLEPNSFLFCYKRNFKTSLSDDNQVDLINSTSSYLNALIHIDNSYFEEKVN